jgi:hypothetical protein
MDWLTKDYIQAEAKKGRKQAIECTRLHWQQLVKAGPDALSDGLKCDDVDISSGYCAMCLRYTDWMNRNPCKKCLLVCLEVWGIANSMLWNWRKKPIRSNWRKWKQASKAMLSKIDRLYERVYGSKK